jgi:uncharacterized RDD family membrane protein YckC
LAAPILDTVVPVETPEGIQIELRPAGIGARALAYLIDLLVRAGLLLGIGTATSLAQFGFGDALLLIAYFVLEWFYPVFFELGQSGATPGKRVMGLRVIMDDGLPVTPAASLTRNLLRTADFLPFMFTAGALSMLLRADFKRLGDLAASTLVVHAPRPAAAVEFDDVEPLPPPVALRLQDQAAVIAFAARLPRMTTDRAHELALLAAPLVGGREVPGSQATARLLSIASWLLGRRDEHVRP